MKAPGSDSSRIIHKMFAKAPYALTALRAKRDDAGRIFDFFWVEVNSHTPKIFGISRDDLLSKSIFDTVPDLVRDNRLTYFEQVINEDKTIRFELKMNNSFVNRWFEVHCWKHEEILIVSLREISKLKNTIKELDKREAEYSTLFRESIDPIFISNSEHHIIDLNPEMKNLFGYHEENHTTLKQLFYKEEDFLKVNTALYKDDFIKDYEAELLTAENKVLICTISVKRYYNAEGIETYVGFIRNITANKKTEKNLIMAEKLSLTGKIARTIAHEVRNPLTNLNLALDQLMDELPEDSDGKFYIAMLRRNMERIQTLIDDLLNSSKPREYNFSEKEIKEILNTTIKLVEDRFLLKEMRIERDFAKEKIMVKHDLEQMKIAFLNLLVNASEAMELSKGVLHVSVRSDESNCIITFRDNGKGIESEKLKNLFEPFFSHSKDSGTGLGLTAVQNIVHGHNGTIEVNSDLGLGTTFTVTLPLA